VGSLKSHYRQAVILWVSLVFSILILSLLAKGFGADIHFLKKDSSSPEVLPLKIFLLCFASLTVLLIWLVPRQILQATATRNIKSSSRLLIASAAAHALCETVAITGLTFLLLTRNPLTFYLFLVLCLTLFAYSFPRYSRWEEWAATGEAVDTPVAWNSQSLFPWPELHQGGAPAPAIFPGQPEGSHLRQPSQNGMHRSA
jgi:hypothetical protein